MKLIFNFLFNLIFYEYYISDEIVSKNISTPIIYLPDKTKSQCGNDDKILKNQCPGIISDCVDGNLIHYCFDVVSQSKNISTLNFPFIQVWNKNNDYFFLTKNGFSASVTYEHGIINYCSKNIAKT